MVQTTLRVSNIGWRCDHLWRRGNDNINISAANPTSAGINDIIIVDGGAGIDAIILRSATAADEQTVQSTATLAADGDIIDGFD